MVLRSVARREGRSGVGAGASALVQLLTEPEWKWPGHQPPTQVTFLLPPAGSTPEAAPIRRLTKGKALSSASAYLAS